MNWDEIQKYLKDRAQKTTVNEEWIQWFKLQHSGRERYPHRHGNDPYCGICDKNIEPNEEVYLFYVGGGLRRNLKPYHVDCVDNHINFKVKAIVEQDRAFRGL